MNSKGRIRPIKKLREFSSPWSFGADASKRKKNVKSNRPLRIIGTQLRLPFYFLRADILDIVPAFSRKQFDRVLSWLIGEGLQTGDSFLEVGMGG